MNYYDNFQGKADASQILLESGKTIRLPANECKFVILSHWNTTEETEPDVIIGGESASAGEEIYYGFNGVIAFQLFRKAQSPILPVSNTNQICVRPLTGKTPYIWFAWFS